MGVNQSQKIEVQERDQETSRYGQLRLDHMSVRMTSPYYVTVCSVCCSFLI
jgi:hypothetical protein